MPTHVRLWHLVRGSLLGRLVMIGRLAAGGFLQAIQALVSSRPDDVVYLPYPAPVTGWWLSFVPQRWRPRCVADAYISLWDSMFRDRKGGELGGWASRLVWRYERRALRSMDMVLVDTVANERQMVADFALTQGKVRSIPLAINAVASVANVFSSHESTRPMRVLFVGTLVPLHGIEVMLSAVERLSDDARVVFRLVGDGQQGVLVERFLREHAPENLTWLREWKSMDEIAGEIASADVCLGVFGGEGKASRVLPFKLYHALAAGKAVVTQASYSLPAGVPALPVVTIEGGDVETRAALLADALSKLAADPVRAKRLGAEARHYFLTYLSGDAVIASWNRWVNT
jgi:glycosyltransferase involved in cell wall biosynthesis